MKLNEAIEIVTKERADHHSLDTDVVGQAERLLIEAGKTVTKWREQHRDLGFLLLPGETEE